MKTQEATWGVRQVEFLGASCCWFGRVLVMGEKTGQEGRPGHQDTHGETPPAELSSLSSCCASRRFDSVFQRLRVGAGSFRGPSRPQGWAPVPLRGPASVPSVGTVPPGGTPGQCRVGWRLFGEMRLSRASRSARLFPRPGLVRRARRGTWGVTTLGLAPGRLLAQGLTGGNGVLLGPSGLDRPGGGCNTEGRRQDGKAPWSPGRPLEASVTEARGVNAGCAVPACFSVT